MVKNQSLATAYDWDKMAFMAVRLVIHERYEIKEPENDLIGEGGMPLGIELAAAWVQMLTPGEILQEIESNFDFLETTMRNVPERHRSVRAVFEYSWNLLQPSERDFMGKLSVFRGGFTREAAGFIAQNGRPVQTLPLLSSLVGKSLLQRGADGRYQLHELLRQFAAENG